MTKLGVHEVRMTFVQGTTNVIALDGVSFDADAGEMIAVVGPSGCGKSTLLNVIGQVISPSGGYVHIDGERLDPHSSARRARARNEVFGYLYQDFALIEHDTAEQNVELPLRYRASRIGGKERHQRACALLNVLGLASEATRLVSQLSGGQRQRVGLARALVNDPAVILADEPTGALDSHTGGEVFALLKQQAEAGRTVVLATHDIDLALACDRVIAMRDGRIVDAAAILPRRMARFEAVREGPEAA